MYRSYFLTGLLTMLAVAANATTIEMKVNGLVCAFCAQGIEKTLRKNSATADVLVSLEHRLVAVELKEGTDIQDEALKAALKTSGYDVETIERTETPLSTIRERLMRDRK